MSACRFAQPVVPAARPRSRVPACRAAAVDAVPAPSRRNVLALGAALAFAAPGAAQAKVPAGFNAVKDTQKGYAFVYPVGWSEVALEGQDKAFKDVIEPLESVSLSVLPTERTSLAQAGTPQEVAQALVSKASSPSTRTELVSASQRTDSTGKAPVVYYSFEFTSAARGVTRHAITTLAIANGKVFTLTTGASAARWSKMESRLKTVSDSLVLLGY